MNATPRERPKAFIQGLVPTLNHRGFMSESLDAFSGKFVEYAATCAAPVLDMGCAYGIATRAALERGARVHACDMEAGHVEILAAETPAELRDRLTTSVGVLPDVSFPAAAFGAILCSRVLHFLLPEEIGRTLAAMHGWLQPGGRLFAVADTPYSGFWAAGAAEYERRKISGVEWPGFIPDIAIYMKDGRRPEGMLPYLNPLDPDILRRECERAGFVVEEAAFTGRAGDESRRHHAGVVASRRRT
jgi:SAM-dependent methyltransferase